MIANNFISKKILVFLLFMAFSLPTYGAIKEIDLPNKSCQNDYQTSVKSLNDNCLQLISSDSKDKAEELIVYLHGDYGVGGSSYMGDIAAHFSNTNRKNIAIIRPGYFDDKGRFSTGNNLGVTSTKIAGRLDNYTRENVDIIAEAILKIKNHYQAKRTLIIGHSGGAALAALILNFHPKLLDGALLINCPYDLKKWRPDWEQSLSPIEHIDAIPKNVMIRVISGAADEVIPPEIGKNYASKLLQNGNNVKFFLGIGMKHNLSDKVTQEVALESIHHFLNEISSTNSASYSKQKKLTGKTKPHE